MYGPLSMSRKCPATCTTMFEHGPPMSKPLEAPSVTSSSCCGRMGVVARLSGRVYGGSCSPLTSSLYLSTRSSSVANE